MEGQEAGTSICSDPAGAALLHAARGARGRARLAAAAVPDGRRPAHRHVVRRGAMTAGCSCSRPATTRSSTTCSPFKLLTYFAIAATPSRDGLREVDFLGDAEPWKLEWTPTTRGARLAVRVREHQASPAFAFDQVPDGAGVEEMASVIGTFVPTYQGLSASALRAAGGRGRDAVSVQRRRIGCRSIARATRSTTCSARCSRRIRR